MQVCFRALWSKITLLTGSYNPPSSVLWKPQKFTYWCKMWLNYWADTWHYNSLKKCERQNLRTKSFNKTFLFLPLFHISKHDKIVFEKYTKFSFSWSNTRFGFAIRFSVIIKIGQSNIYTSPSLPTGCISHSFHRHIRVTYQMKTEQFIMPSLEEREDATSIAWKRNRKKNEDLEFTLLAMDDLNKNTVSVLLISQLWILTHEKHLVICVYVYGLSALIF